MQVLIGTSTTLLHFFKCDVFDEGLGGPEAYMMKDYRSEVASSLSLKAKITPIIYICTRKTDDVFRGFLWPQCRL